MATDLTGLLFGSYRRQIFELLLGEPGLSLHVREIARRTGIPPGSLHRELRALADAGVLERTPAAGRVRYRADRGCRLFEPLSAIFAPRPALRAAEPPAAYAAAPQDARERAFHRLNVPERVLVAFGRRHGLKRLSLFGSVTRDDFRPDSDVDVLVEFAGRQREPFAIQDMADELSGLFGGRDVDVVTPSVFSNPIRRASIERDLLTVHGE